MSDQVKFVLDESHLPEAWYNLVSALPEQPPPVLHPGTGEPVGPDDLAPLFPMQIILQEVATDQYVPIPEEVRSIYRQWRPTPLYRARRLAHRLAQAEHRGRTGLLQQARGRLPSDDRDRRRAVGLRSRLRGRDLRARGRRLHGQGELRTKAVPPRPHRGVRRPLRSEPFAGDEVRARNPG